MEARIGSDNGTGPSAPTYGLPHLIDEKQQDKYPLLLVYLAKQTPAEQAYLASRLHEFFRKENITLTRWQPSSGLLRRVALHGSCPDSQANIHAMAILAYRAGWTRFLVADGLTQRQVHGNLRLWEDPLLSLVMVVVKPEPVVLAPTGDFCVFAKRTTVDGFSKDFLEKLSNLQPPKRSLMHNIERDRYDDPGLTLYDPDRPPFSADRATSLSHEERFNITAAFLTKHTPLPPELAEQVLDWLSIANETPMWLPPWIYHKEKHLNIFLLFPATQPELHHIQTLFQNVIEDYRKIERAGVRSYTITFIPWEYHRTRSRRDLANLWEAYRLRTGDNSAPFNIYFLQQMPVAQNVNDLELGIVKYERGDLPNVARITLKNVILDRGPWIEMMRRRGQAAEQYMYSHKVDPELLRPFDQPFYPNPPRWLPAKKGQYTIPVFYLTKGLSRTEKYEIEKEIRTLGQVEESHWGSKVACYVPWDGEADGTFDDVWKIFWEVFTYHGERDSHFPIFFIDAQSAMDDTVLVVHPDHLWFDQSNSRALAMLQNVMYPSVRGLQYGRVRGREAHTMHSNVSVGNMFFEEYTRPQRFPRPDWPCHGFTAAQV
ncbi:hypothetical protein AtubIFM55763_007429 [Aspergillus tubingensis]|uniref:Uncharacterized protein n=2 Tax=Aspergillus subgen. Circumdati TaxID=2720871 RepID=A0A8H3SNC7_ASPTU|nr:similar to An15g04430 [Aspergillus tubingensis]GAQ40616.1 similar to An15g04430 [Aspergillus niger]GFN12451.1 similar to An15g04430 [Aspergillus tubingensis]GLA56413.1 hypothetical protein AtubIFM54640_000065 [Aspergillus tubingensis]GLA75873.1 hypothetical protein AtubIFM55763_007429 [Aspergillus tubingensis]GLA86413.1 hypothetical protein AtubIFM56815_010678 [Aspergillus tubingensis]